MEGSIEVLAKYPFIPEASEYFKVRTGVGEIVLADFEKIEYEKIVNRAVERVQEALEREEVSYKSVDVDVELLSFPLALAIVKAVGDSFLSQRYALAEAKRLMKILQNEKNPTILLRIANEVLMWRSEHTKAPYDYALSVKNYLQIAPVFHDKSWKLVNKPVRDGYVYLTKGEFIRLIAEGIKSMIEDELEERYHGELPSKLEKIVNDIRLLISEKRPKVEGLEEEYRGKIILEIFPPCIGAFYQALINGQHLPHTARFAVTSFLLNIGVDPEDIIKLFIRLPDANERITRYQVEHIAGLRGSRTKYTPPKCETLKTYGLCVEGGKFCRGIKHPLSYYRRAIRRIRRVGRIGEGEKPEVSKESV